MRFCTATMLAAASAAFYVLVGAVFAAEPCDIPASLLSGGYDLKQVAEAVSSTSSPASTSRSSASRGAA
jgi:hypothetical protein